LILGGNVLLAGFEIEQIVGVLQFELGEDQVGPAADLAIPFAMVRSAAIGRRVPAISTSTVTFTRWERLEGGMIRMARERQLLEIVGALHPSPRLARPARLATRARRGFQ
jgi:hypothetical protein